MEGQPCRPQWSGSEDASGEDARVALAQDEDPNVVGKMHVGLKEQRMPGRWPVTAGHRAGEESLGPRPRG